jgi:predicted phosphodiesterase
MRLNVLSDLHLGFSGFERPRNDADAVVLAGDIARPREAAAWALGFDKPVFYVLGNHEFYGGSLQGTADELKRLVAGSHVQVLDDTEVVCGGVRFLGSTLWTDFRLCGDGAARAAAMAEAQLLMRDFSRIRNDAGDAPFTPDDAAARFARHAAWLQRRLEVPHAGPTVVITHHAPSRGSIHPRFAGSPLNASFVSDAEYLLGGERVQCWIHGHTHDSFDYVAQGTRVVCNPRGYAKHGVAENARFAAGFIVDV